ncbi:MAG: hypothetical protein SXA11_03775 [Cyanobacteriota bacterium]|nr:hypothetical protein [Cyanobacteriota bacterium]
MAINCCQKDCLTYYHLNKDEINAEIAAEEAEGDRIEAEHKAGKVTTKNYSKPKSFVIF